MNLIQKLNSYLHLKKFNVRKSWTKSALTTFDYYLITWIIAAILLAIAYTWRVEIDNAKLNYAARINFMRAEHVKTTKAMQRYENLLIAGLNGQYVKVEGVTRRMAFCDAAGECK